MIGENMIYSTRVNTIGQMVGAFGGKMLILFGNEAPDTLKDFCYGIDVNKTEEALAPGQTISFGDSAINITNVGDMAERNLNALGHLTVLFGAAEDEMLPGSIIVDGEQVPEIPIGTHIRID